MQRLKRFFSARRRQRFATSYRAAVSDISLRLQDQATAQTADYVLKHLPRVDPVGSWRAVHDVALEHADLEGGLVLEFGVFSGTTVNYLAGKRLWRIDAFDSFEGLPESWRGGYPKGKFARATPPRVAANVTLHIGWFDQTLPPFVAALKTPDQPVRYLHIDCDLYSSTKTIFDALGDRIVPGSVIVFDEYFNYAGWQEGEFKAFQEFISRRGLHYDYLTYNHTHQQVAVKIR